MTRTLAFDEATLAKLEAGCGIGAGREFIPAPENRAAGTAKAAKAKPQGAAGASAKHRHPAD